MPRLAPRRQGDLGEYSAIEWLGSQGYAVFVPVGHSADVDLIAEREGELLRVQVKTSTVYENRRWKVMVCTRGGNRSWSGLVKRFDPARCDALFVLVADGRRWFVPAGAVGGGSSVNLGGPRYSRFEVTSGSPLHPRAAG